LYEKIAFLISRRYHLSLPAENPIMFNIGTTGAGHCPGNVISCINPVDGQWASGNAQNHQMLFLKALSWHVGSPLIATGFEGIPPNGGIQAATRKNRSYLLLHEADGSSTRTLDLILQRGDRQLSVAGILLPDDRVLLFRAVATVLQMERECGFTQAADDNAVHLLRRQIARQLSEGGIYWQIEADHYNAGRSSSAANDRAIRMHAARAAAIAARRRHVPAPPPFPARAIAASAATADSPATAATGITGDTGDTGATAIANLWRPF
jgi:hypothetical protein